MIRTLFVILVMMLGGNAWAQTCDTHSGLPVPRFVSLKFSNVNGRIGPSEGHEIRWNYIFQGLPIEIIAETAQWRQVRDPGGEITWMHQRTLTGTRTVLTREETTLYDRPDEGALPNAVAESGAVLQLEECRNGWCRLTSGRLQGWAPGSALWGLYDEERTGMSSLIDSASLCIRSTPQPSP